MNKKLIVQVSEGLGNQLFMYAHALSLSKKYDYNLLIDTISGYKKQKNLLRDHQKYMLHLFNLPNTTISNDFLIDGYFSYLFKKFFLLLDNFKSTKSFYIEQKKTTNKIKTITNPTLIKSSELANKIYVIGNFEDQNYFKDSRTELLKSFTPKKNYLKLENPIINDLKNSNSISIHIRRNRFADQKGLTNNQFLNNKSDKYTFDTLDYINKSIIYFNNKIKNPKYFIWSNDFKNIEKFTSKLIISDFKLLKNNDAINDFYFFKFSKHFIVSPSSYHWWGAWLNENKDKICLRPSNINPSNNFNFWPNEWISI